MCDHGFAEIADSLQLIARRTAQAFNARKHHKGAFWEDRYHATAVDRGQYLARCLVCIDLNMVRAGVVRRPRRARRCPAARVAQLAPLHREWIDVALHSRATERAAYWSENLTVGRRSFVARVQDTRACDGQVAETQMCTQCMIPAGLIASLLAAKVSL